MKRLSKLFLTALLLTVASISWGICNDLLCGKWRSSSGVALQIAPSTIWLGRDFEATVSVPGHNFFSSGFRIGDIVYRINNVGKGQYTGEQLLKNQGTPVGWSFVEMSLENKNMLVVTDQSGNFSRFNRVGEHSTLPRQTKSSGTGFLVSNDGLIVTNHHVIEDANEISVRVSTGETFIAKVVSASASTDLALLRIPYQTKNYLTFEQPGSVEIGDDVFTLGFPISDILGKEVKYTDGSISSLTGLQGDATFFQISVPIQPGNSGGPLVNKKGNVVGIVTSTAAVEVFYKTTGSLPQNVNWAVKGAYASLLLPPGIRQDERSIGNPITNAKWSVVFIETK